MALQGKQDSHLSVMDYSPQTSLRAHQGLQCASLQEANRAEQSHQELVQLVQRLLDNF
jgi:hypothetical protein